MNIPRWVSDSFDRFWERHVFMATVTGTSGTKVTIKPSTDSVAAGSYVRLASYTTPTNNDLVLCIRVGGGIIVLGKVA